MAGWGKGLGDFSGPRERAFAGVTKAAPRRSPGRHPAKETGHGERGGTVSRSLEEYLNQNSQWSRWRKGLGLYFQAVRASGLEQVPALALFRTTGILKPRSLSTLTSFPAQGAEDRVWVVVSRVRGSIMAPGPLQASELTLDTSSPDPEDWRLWYAPSGNPATVEKTLRFLQHMVGDLFEDSAVPIAGDEPYYEALLPLEADAIKLQLMEVDLFGRRLGFAINRWREQSLQGRVLVQRNRRTEDRSKLPSWRPGRVLVSSAKFNCSCPDFLGRRYPDLLAKTSDLSLTRRFPLPSAGRRVGKETSEDAGTSETLESHSAGIYSQWKVVNRMRLETAECKHVHATRWLYGCPMEEPPDMPIGETGEALRRAAEEEVNAILLGPGGGGADDPWGPGQRPVREGIERKAFSRNNADAYAAAASLATGLLIEAPTDIYGNVRPFDIWGYRSLLWTTGEEPRPQWCRQNDWWSPTGASDVFRFDEATNGFREADGELRKAFFFFSELEGQLPATLSQQLRLKQSLQLDYRAVVVP